MKKTMKFAHKTFSCLLISTMVSVAAHAVPFYGTIKQTITSTDDPLYHAGQTVFGWYQYDAPSVEGDFGTSWYCVDNPAALPTLYGSLFGFFDSDQGGWLSIRTGNYSSLTHLSVDEDHVVDFYKTGQIGGVDFSFDGGGFHLTNMAGPNGFAYETTGTLCFSTPVSVPEGMTNTATFFLLGLAGLTVIRRRFLR